MPANAEEKRSPSSSPVAAVAPAFTSLLPPVHGFVRRVLESSQLTRFAQTDALHLTLTPTAAAHPETGTGPVRLTVNSGPADDGAAVHLVTLDVPCQFRPPAVADTDGKLADQLVERLRHRLQDLQQERLRACDAELLRLFPTLAVAAKLDGLRESVDAEFELLGRAAGEGHLRSKLSWNPQTLTWQPVDRPGFLRAAARIAAALVTPSEVLHALACQSDVVQRHQTALQVELSFPPDGPTSFPAQLRLRGALTHSRAREVAADPVHTFLLTCRCLGPVRLRGDLAVDPQDLPLLETRLRKLVGERAPLPWKRIGVASGSVVLIGLIGFGAYRFATALGHIDRRGVRPQNDSEVDPNDPVELRWPHVRNAKHYVVLFGEGAASEPLLVTGESAAVPALEPGKTYAWTLRAQNEGDETPPERFTFRTREPASPLGELDPAAIQPANGLTLGVDETEVTLVWPAVEHADRYEVQLVTPTGTRALPVEGTRARADGLSPGTAYRWKLVIHGGQNVKPPAREAEFAFSTAQPPPPAPEPEPEPEPEPTDYAQQLAELLAAQGTEALLREVVPVDSPVRADLQFLADVGQLQPPAVAKTDRTRARVTIEYAPHIAGAAGQFSLDLSTETGAWSVADVERSLANAAKQVPEVLQKHFEGELARVQEDANAGKLKAAWDALEPAGAPALLAGLDTLGADQRIAALRTTLGERAKALRAPLPSRWQDRTGFKSGPVHEQIGYPTYVEHVATKRRFVLVCSYPGDPLAGSPLPNGTAPTGWYIFYVAEAERKGDEKALPPGEALPTLVEWQLAALRVPQGPVLDTFFGGLRELCVNQPGDAAPAYVCGGFTGTAGTLKSKILPPRAPGQSMDDWLRQWKALAIQPLGYAAPDEVGVRTVIRVYP